MWIILTENYQEISRMMREVKKRIFYWHYLIQTSPIIKMVALISSMGLLLEDWRDV